MYRAKGVVPICWDEKLSWSCSSFISDPRLLGNVAHLTITAQRPTKKEILGFKTPHKQDENQLPLSFFPRFLQKVKTLI